jgi:5-enolpyruvylshikimate-3-phosphate synthase
MSIEIHHSKTPLKGEVELCPDRELSSSAIALGVLARGLTLLPNKNFSSDTLLFLKLLQECGAQIKEEPTRWLIEGTGFNKSFCAKKTLGMPFEKWSQALALFFISTTKETPHEIAFEPSSQNHIEFITGLLNGKLTASGPGLAEVIFERTPFHKCPENSFLPDHIATGIIALNSLLNKEPFKLTTSESFRDHLFYDLKEFGLPIEIQKSETEELSEIEKRLARLKGNKQERTASYNFEPAPVLKALDIQLPGDTTQAALFCLAATLIPGSDIVIPGVHLNTSRSGFFNALRRMGANIDVLRKKQINGHSYGQIRVRHVRRLIGRKITGDLLLTCLEEIPLLAVAACFADGESIIRLPPSLVPAYMGQLEAIVNILKSTGTDIGLFEEGLVIRGKEECDATEFTIDSDKTLAHAIFVLAKSSKGISKISGLDTADSFLPGTLNYLRGEHEL